MDSRDNPVYWSIPCGNWFMTHVRVSVWIGIPIAYIFWQLGWDHYKVGLLLCAVLFVTLLIHEFSHIIAVRWTGGVGNEILIWPLGGLAFVQPGGSFRSQFLTPAAGPLSNLALCLAVAVPCWRAGGFPHLLNPVAFPLESCESMSTNCLFALIFWCNWTLLLVNLLPVFPLDGVRIVLAFLKNRTDIEAAADAALRISLMVAFMVMLTGLFLNQALIVFFGAVILIMSLLEWVQVRTAEVLDDSFMGYDFSQGYTSLERSTKQGQPARRPRRSWFEAWRERRKVARERRARLEVEQAQQQLDAILEKVHLNGIGSLSDAERRQLNRASDRLRDRGKQTE